MSSRQARDCTRVIAAASNLAIQYNFQAIPVALLMMDSAPGMDNSTAAYPRCVACCRGVTEACAGCALLDERLARCMRISSLSHREPNHFRCL
jgi:hypothetical protein